jgi:hypothetical protein
VREASLSLVMARALACLACRVCLACLACLACGNAAAAEPGEHAEPADRYGRAQDEDAHMQFAAALQDYEHALASAPSDRRAPLAQARIADLRAHAEGDFAPLQRLERVKRDPRLAADAGAIDALVREADQFPPGAVRVEAWVLAAEAYAHRLGRPHDAIPLYKRVLRDPAADPVLAKKAARDLVTMLLADRDWTGATDAARFGGPELTRLVARAVRRRWLHFASIGVLGALVALTVRAARRNMPAVIASTRKALPLVVAYAAYVAVAGALLASGYEPGSGTPFLAFGAALVLVLLVARAWASAGSAGRGARAGRGVLAASSAVAAAFLVLEAVDMAYLDGLGL